MTGANVASLRRISFKQFHANGTLTVFPGEADGVPFPIRRVFTLSGVPAGDSRADHAHRRCSQMLACLSGRVTVRITDGTANVEEVLEPDGDSLLIPPMLWNSVVFELPSTVIAVFCDELYEEDDYVRDWSEYLDLQGVTK